MECDVVNRILVIEAFVEVHQLVDVQLAYLSQAGATGAAALRMVEGKCIGISYERLSDAGKEEPQQRVDVRVGGYRRAGIGGRFFLVNDYRHGQVLHAADMRAAVLREVLLHE